MSVGDIISLVFSITSLIISILVIFLEFRNNKKLNNREKQREIYERFIKLYESVKINQMIMFDSKFVNELKSYKIEFEINASKRVNNEYYKLVKIYESIYDNYYDYYNSIDPYRDDNIIEEYDEDGNFINEYLKDNSITDEMLLYYDSKYKKENVYSKEMVEKLFSKLHKLMLKDLK